MYFNLFTPQLPMLKEPKSLYHLQSYHVVSHVFDDQLMQDEEIFQTC